MLVVVNDHHDELVFLAKYVCNTIIGLRKKQEGMK